jgi:hypothetical protein
VPKLEPQPRISFSHGQQYFEISEGQVASSIGFRFRKAHTGQLESGVTAEKGGIFIKALHLPRMTVRLIKLAFRPNEFHH